jgi:hypothetical protein
MSDLRRKLLRMRDLRSKFLRMRNIPSYFTADLMSSKYSKDNMNREKHDCPGSGAIAMAFY